MRLFIDIVSELVLIFLYPLSALFINFIPKHYFEDKFNNGKTILIVERWLTFNIRHLYWKLYLEDKGYRVFIVNFSLLKGTFENSSHKLQKYIDDKNLHNLTLVGISGGAITSLLYLQNLEGWSRVDKFISIGAPFKGTWCAVFVSFCKSGRELFPFSSLVAQIKGMNILNSQKIVCIRAKFDEMVWSGSILQGARKVTINVFGHNNLHIRIKQTYRKIIEIAD